MQKPGIIKTFLSKYHNFEVKRGQFKILTRVIFKVLEDKKLREHLLMMSYVFFVSFDLPITYQPCPTSQRPIFWAILDPLPLPTLILDVIYGRYLWTFPNGLIIIIVILLNFALIEKFTNNGN